MSDLKHKMRPEIPSINLDRSSSEVELFQNKVLRPIIKLQHELIMCCFSDFITQNKVLLNEYNEEKKKIYLQKLFKTNTVLKTELRGLIIGLFTLEEYKHFLSIKPMVIKRINTIIQNRITSNLLESEN
ncbi:hypothetical protein N9J06_00960 [Flavobacteriales bacterium]|jgi:hypothetical protein|nr:hypothetical protein [Flavobacteriales bacterium]